jgi:hypothetical protein
MTKLAFDTNALVYLFGFGHDASMTSSVNGDRKEWLAAIHNARSQDVTLFIPTPALAEFFGCKRVNEEQCQVMERHLRDYFSFAPFSARSADLLAKSWRGGAYPSSQTNDRLQRNEIRFDQLVMSIALEHNATHLITHDRALRRHVAASGFQLTTWSLNELADHYKGKQADIFSFQQIAPTAAPATPRKKQR